MPKIKCCVCGKEVDYTKEQCVRSKIKLRRYSHFACEPDGEWVPLPPPKEPKVKAPKVPVEKKLTLEQEILSYCETVFGKDKTNYAMIRRQIKQFKKDYQYTESGILKTLKFMYEIEHTNAGKANGAIGLVPYVYPRARDYYFRLYQANQANEQIEPISATQSKEVTIKLKFKELKKKLFHFEEEED